jgi:prepilin-type N-terminal cleavage/methylation domain-containing protein
MCKMTPTNRTGLTLIEMMVALAAGLIVMLGTASLLALAQKSWNREWDQANLQRDVSRAMLKVKQSVRNATHAQLDADGYGVKIFHTGGWIRFCFISGQKDLRYQLEGETEQTLLDGVVEDATFEVDTTTNKTVTVGLELKKGPCEAQLSSTTMMRNYASGT